MPFDFLSKQSSLCLFLFFSKVTAFGHRKEAQLIIFHRLRFLPMVHCTEQEQFMDYEGFYVACIQEGNVIRLSDSFSMMFTSAIDNCRPEEGGGVGWGGEEIPMARASRGPTP